MDVLREYHAIKTALDEKDALQYPYGMLDYKDTPGDINLKWAYVPDIEPEVKEWLEEPHFQILNLRNLRIQARHLGGELELQCLDTFNNTIYAGLVRRQRPRRIAYQRWERKVINGEYDFRCSNWIGEGPELVPDYEWRTIELTNDLTTVLQRPVMFTSQARISDIALYLLKALLERQAKGERIVQALHDKLRIAGVTSGLQSLKIVPFDAGGYRITGEGKASLTVSELVLLVNNVTNSNIK